MPLLASMSSGRLWVPCFLDMLPLVPDSPYQDLCRAEHPVQVRGDRCVRGGYGFQVSASILRVFLPD